MTVIRPEATAGAATVDRVAERLSREAAVPRRSGREAEEIAEVKGATETSSRSEFPLHNLSIRLDPETKRVVAEVIDSNTGEVVRKVPPDELARIDRDLGPRRGRLLEREV